MVGSHSDYKDQSQFSIGLGNLKTILPYFHDHNRGFYRISLSLVAGFEFQVSSVTLQLSTPVRVWEREVWDSLTTNAGDIGHIELLSVAGTSKIAWIQRIP